MGHRANFVIIREGDARAYQDQWAALGAVYEFAAGPAHAATAAEHMEPTTELMDWAFAEGGYLIDFDEKCAIVFGYPGDLDLEDMDFEDIDADEEAEAAAVDAALQSSPEDFLRAIAARWQSWLLHWDDRGVDAFAAHLSRRGITSIKAQAPRQPPAGTAVTLQVDPEPTSMKETP